MLRLIIHLLLNLSFLQYPIYAVEEDMNSSSDETYEECLASKYAYEVAKAADKLVLPFDIVCGLSLESQDEWPEIVQFTKKISPLFEIRDYPSLEEASGFISAYALTKQLTYHGESEAALAKQISCAPKQDRRQLVKIICKFAQRFKLYGKANTFIEIVRTIPLSKLQRIQDILYQTLPPSTTELYSPILSQLIYHLNQKAKNECSALMKGAAKIIKTFAVNDIERGCEIVRILSPIPIEHLDIFINQILKLNFIPPNGLIEKLYLEKPLAWTAIIDVILKFHKNNQDNFWINILRELPDFQNQQPYSNTLLIFFTELQRLHDAGAFTMSNLTAKELRTFPQNQWTKVTSFILEFSQGQQISYITVEDILRGIRQIANRVKSRQLINEATQFMITTHQLYQEIHAKNILCTQGIDEQSYIFLWLARQETSAKLKTSIKIITETRKALKATTSLLKALILTRFTQPEEWLDFVQTFPPGTCNYTDLHNKFWRNE